MLAMTQELLVSEIDPLNEIFANQLGVLQAQSKKQTAEYESDSDADIDYTSD